jgi:hypothetical protein
MPQRKNIQRFVSADIQGEDSWVEMSQLTVGEARRINKDQGRPGADMEDVLPYYVKHIYAWNWVDDDGEPLPLPKEDSEVIDRLTAAEFSFISECLAGNEAERKKS